MKKSMISLNKLRLLRMLVLFTKGTGETFENKAKEQEGGFLGKLLGTLGAS